MEIAEVAQTATTALESSKSAHHRLDTLEREVSNVHDLATAMATVSTKVDNLTGDIGEIKDSVKTITDRPRKLWDKLIGAIIGTLGTGIAAAILAIILK